MEKLLEHEIDDSVAQMIIGKLTEYQKKTAQVAKSATNKAVNEAKKDFSAKLIATINEKDRIVDNLKNEVSNYKKEMATKVSSFLANTKEEIRDVVAEEIQLDPKFGEATQILAEIRKIVNPIDTEITVKQLNDTKAISEKRINELNDAITFLKKRLENKESANEILKAKVRVNELMVSVPSSDRETFKRRLTECKTVNSVESTFKNLKEKVSKRRIEMVEESTKAPKGRGKEIVFEEKTPEPRPTVRPPQSSTAPLVNRMQVLAGMK